MIFKKLSSTFVFLLLLISCSTTNNDLVGSYVIHKPILPIKLFQQYWYNGLVVGTELELKADSTFVHKNCSVIMQGNWKVKKDSLYFIVIQKKWRIDSLNYSSKWKANLKTMCKDGSYYKIKGEFLKCKYGNSAYEVLEKL